MSAESLPIKPISCFDVLDYMGKLAAKIKELDATRRPYRYAPLDAPDGLPLRITMSEAMGVYRSLPESNREKASRPDAQSNYEFLLNAVKLKKLVLL